MATENVFTVQFNNSGGIPQPFDVKADCSKGMFFLAGGDDTPRDFGEVILLPIVHKYKNTKMYNLINYPDSAPNDYLNIYFVALATGNVFSMLIKKSSEGSYIRFMQSLLAFGQPSDALKTKVRLSFRDDTFKNGKKGKTVVFTPTGEATPEQVQAITDFFAVAEPMHLISHRNVNQYCEANGLVIEEELPILLGINQQQKQLSDANTK